MNAVQIGLVGVAGALLAIQFKNGKSEYGIYLSVAVSIFIFLNIVGRLEIILETLRAIGDMITIDRAYIGTLLKMVGITMQRNFPLESAKMPAIRRWHPRLRFSVN